jgi:hypothetical protein
VRCGHVLLGNGGGLALLAANDEGDLNGCFLTESLDGFLELHALDRALGIVFLICLLVLLAYRIELSRGLTLGSLSTLGIWKVARVATDALPASDTDGAEALERVRGERVAAIVKKCYTVRSQSSKQEQMQAQLKESRQHDNF